MTSIFRLDCVRVYDTDEHLYRDASYSMADYSGDLINGEVWKEVDIFEGDSRSDEEIITAWSGHGVLFL